MFLLFAVAGFVVYDRRQNYRYILVARQKAMFWYDRVRINLIRLRERKDEKKKEIVTVEEAASSSKSYGAL